MSCLAEEGIPHPEIEWRRPDGSRLKSEQLWIDSASDSDSGVYNCSAVNEYGSDARTVNLQVLEPTKVRIEPSKVDDAQTLATVTFSCIVESDPRLKERPTVTWYKGQELVSSSEVLVLSNVTKSSSGRYFCQVTSTELNETTTESAHLHVPGLATNSIFSASSM